MSMVITYETLFDILRKESGKDDLQVLPENFYEDIKAFLREKKSSGDGYRSKIEYENSKKIVRELYDRRERKILLLALNKARTQSAIIDPSTLLTHEKKLFDELARLLEQTKKQTIIDIIGTTNNYLTNASTTPIKTPAAIQAPTPKSPQKQAPLESTEPQDPEQTTEETPVRTVHKKNPTPQGYVKVKFLHAVPRFVGQDMTIFGPFDPGAQTELPQAIVDILLKKGRIELED